MADQVISLTVAVITFIAEDGTCVFSGVDVGGVSVRVVARKNALPRPPLVGEVWQLCGDFQTHAKYGKQFQVRTGKYEVPKGRLIVSYLATNRDFPGIGEGKAKALYDRFGDGLIDLLGNGDVAALEEVLVPAMAERLIAAWHQKVEEAKLIGFLDALGFEVHLANKLRRVWGSQALAMLESNPYYMLAFTSWGRTDAAAMKLGLQRDDERRLVGAVEAALYSRLQDAHTVTPAPLLVLKVEKLLGRKAADQAIELALAEGAIVGDAMKGYQAIGAAALEARIAERIRSMLDGESPTQLSLPTMRTEGDIGAWLDGAIAENEAAQGFKLNSRQRQAVLMAVTKPFSVVTGGAGVGKTTVLKVVIDVAMRLNLKVLQMALAGRAAKRMAEATESPAMTIAKFLHEAKKGAHEVSADTLVIVDEASMLDLPTMFRILRYLPDGCRLLLVGDSAQLPPIGFGLVFHRLVESRRVPRVALTEVHRQAAETGIPAVAAAIRSHMVPDVAPYSGQKAGVAFIECETEDIVEELHRLASEWTDDDWQVLSAVKGGRSGIDIINGFFHSQHCGEKLEGFNFGVGEPVVHLINDYELGLMNGTLGRIRSVQNGPDAGLLIDFEGADVFLPAGELAERLQRAYALSVHKAQGSQFRRVAIVMTKSKVLDHALVYTALTRGIEQVVFVGDRAAFANAVAAPALAHMRQVGFAL